MLLNLVTKIWFHLDCIMQLKESYYIATDVCSRKSATTFGDLPDWIVVTWPSGAIWDHRSGSKLFEVMAWCLVSPNHHMDQHWPIISKVLWHLHEDNITKFVKDINHWNASENHRCEIKLLVIPTRGQWVKCHKVDKVFCCNIDAPFNAVMPSRRMTWHQYATLAFMPDRVPSSHLNSLVPGGCDYSLKLVNFKRISTMNILCIFCEMAIRWMPQHLTDHKSTLVQVMAWCYLVISSMVMFWYVSYCSMTLFWKCLAQTLQTMIS